MAQIEEKQTVEMTAEEKAQFEAFRTKSVCFGIKVLYSGADLRSDTLFPFSDCCYIGNISFEERVTVLVFAHYPAESINQ